MTAKDTELEVMVGIARRAGALVAELHQRHLDAGLEVELKGPNDPVTQADREANALICGALAEAFPDALVVGEESAPSGEDLARLKVAPRIFFVDPLDGT
ncbi:MAG: inositol monophosphatase family protein, partial [Polyangiaceae bacterium]